MTSGVTFCLPTAKVLTPARIICFPESMVDLPLCASRVKHVNVEICMREISQTCKYYFLHHLFTFDYLTSIFFRKRLIGVICPTPTSPHPHTRLFPFVETMPRKPMHMDAAHHQKLLTGSAVTSHAAPTTIHRTMPVSLEIRWTAEIMGQGRWAVLPAWKSRPQTKRNPRTAASGSSVRRRRPSCSDNVFDDEDYELHVSVFRDVMSLSGGGANERAALVPSSPPRGVAYDSLCARPYSSNVSRHRPPLRVPATGYIRRAEAG